MAHSVSLFIHVLHSIIPKNFLPIQLSPSLVSARIVNLDEDRNPAQTVGFAIARAEGTVRFLSRIRNTSFGIGSDEKGTEKARRVGEGVAGRERASHVRRAEGWKVARPARLKKRRERHAEGGM